MTNLLTNLPDLDSLDGPNPWDEEDFYLEGSGFRLQQQRMGLTYKTHIDKQSLIDALTELGKGKGLEIKEIYVAHETGSHKKGQPDYPHTHVAIDWGKPFNTKDCRIFDTEVEDIGVIHPHIKKIMKPVHWRNAVRYLAKEDPENAHLKSYGKSECAKIWDCKNIQEALETACGHERLNSALAAIQVYKHKPVQNYDWTLPKLRPFQEFIWEKCHGPVDNRAINWIVDDEGGPRGDGGDLGKTSFMRHCLSAKPEKFKFVRQIGGAYHLAQNIKRWRKDEGWDGDSVIFDLTRETEEKRSIYDGLEMMVDCICTSVKYEGGDLMWRPTHVWVFANYHPDLSTMSHDRWHLWKVNRETMQIYPLQVNIKKRLVKGGEDEVKKGVFHK